MDNSVVTLASTFTAVEPETSVKRWSSKEKKTISVPCPAIISEYNKSMGGVDLMDMLLNLYLIDRKSKKWYMKLFYHLIGISVTNCWLLHRRHHEQLEGQKSSVCLKDFLISIATGLAKASKTTTSKRKHPSVRVFVNLDNTRCTDWNSSCSDSRCRA